MSGFPVLHYLPDFVQAHVHWIGDAIQPFYPLLPTSPPAFLQSFPASGSFSMNWLFTTGGQSTGASALVLPMNVQGWFPLWLTGLIFLLSKGLVEFSPAPQFKASILQQSAFFMVQFSHPYMTTGKIIALTRWTIVSKVMSLFFNMLSGLVTAFFLRSKYLLISWLQLPSTAVILEPKKIKSATCFHFFPICLPWSDGTGCQDFNFLKAEL